MKNFLPSDFVQRWLWLCPALGVALAAGVLMLFGITLQTALLAALLLVCPAIFVWAFLTFFSDLRRERAARKAAGPRHSDGPGCSDPVPRQGGKQAR